MEKYKSRWEGFWTHFRIVVISWGGRGMGLGAATGTSEVSLTLYFLKKSNVTSVNICSVRVMGSWMLYLSLYFPLCLKM